MSQNLGSPLVTQCHTLSTPSASLTCDVICGCPLIRFNIIYFLNEVMQCRGSTKRCSTRKHLEDIAICSLVLFVKNRLLPASDFSYPIHMIRTLILDTFSYLLVHITLQCSPPKWCNNRKLAALPPLFAVKPEHKRRKC